MTQHKCTEFIPMPDSLAKFCKECGQVFILEGNKWVEWDYRSGNIKEWLKDLVDMGKKYRE